MYKITLKNNNEVLRSCDLEDLNPFSILYEFEKSYGDGTVLKAIEIICRNYNSFSISTLMDYYVSNGMKLNIETK